MRVERKQSPFYSQSYAAPNPIITVTEHTPTPSPDYMKRHVSTRLFQLRIAVQSTKKFQFTIKLWKLLSKQASIDSQLDQMSIHDRLEHERKPSLARSQTDSNITYSSDELPEAPGSSNYITKEGDIDYRVVLKASSIFIFMQLFL